MEFPNVREWKAPSCVRILPPPSLDIVLYSTRIRPCHATFHFTEIRLDIRRRISFTPTIFHLK